MTAASHSAPASETFANAGTARLRFLGAARMVTGSCYLLEIGSRRVLIDCGLFQGSKSVKELNYGRFPFDPAQLDAVLLTHAHIDHSGLLPKLVRDGYRGRVLTTAGSRDLLTYMLPDSGYIQEIEVEHLNRRRTQRGEAPFSPIYTKAMAQAMLSQIDAVPFETWLEPIPGLRARFWNAGHILGAASIELEVGATIPLRLLFSGDIGGGERAMQHPARAPSNFDYLVVESTYGNRDRQRVSAEERRAQLAEEVRGALRAGGNLILPVFAVERTQELLLDLGLLFATGQLPDTSVFLDSPLAIRATEVFENHADELGAAAAIHDPFHRPNFHFVEPASESKKLNQINGGAIIMAASGMCDAGRIRHHLKNNLWRSNATVLLVGFQAPGTLGYLLQSGVRAVRIQGEEIKVEARIRHLDTYSAHADRGELRDWVAERMPIRRAIILTHGEPDGIAGLEAVLRSSLPDPPPILAPPLDCSLDLAATTLQLVTERKRLADDAIGRSDWHNEYAALLLDLGDRLRSASDDAARYRLLSSLAAALSRPRAGQR